MKLLKLFLDRYTPQFIRDSIGLLNKIVYKGTDYKCPVCLSNLKSLYPLPEDFRVEVEINNHIYAVYDFETLNVENYQCPVCRCSDRERLYALYLTKRIEEPGANKTII
ncbi:MAG: hypothetical protein KAJ10_11930, partial [Thermodesulfovibrionia bacterium]|nr:hypothetical protein [Thermodesulfovibrionia bacterium]